MVLYLLLKIYAVESHKDQFLALYCIYYELHPLVILLKSMEFDFYFYVADSQLFLAFEAATDEQLGAIVRIETCVREVDLWMLCYKLKLNGESYL